MAGVHPDLEHTSPIRVTHPERLLADRARARTIVACNATNRDDLRELLGMLGLWPAQDTEATTDPWPLPTEREPGTYITRRR